jgi:hypothetical protein
MVNEEWIEIVEFQDYPIGNFYYCLHREKNIESSYSYNSYGTRNLVTCKIIWQTLAEIAQYRMPENESIRNWKSIAVIPEQDRYYNWERIKCLCSMCEEKMIDEYYSSSICTFAEKIFQKTGQPSTLVCINCANIKDSQKSKWGLNVSLSNEIIQEFQSSLIKNQSVGPA